MFDIIYADPPWDFETYSDKGADRSPDYPTMDLVDIMKLPVKQLASDNSVLFLWCTDPFMPQVVHVMNAWGFEYSTKAFCWVKKNKVANTLFMGLGYWTRANPEDCWLGVRGEPKRVSKSVRRAVVARVGQHSAKPLVVKRRIVQLMGDVPRIELFAREVTPGWHAVGYEVDGRDIRLSLRDYLK